jgi:thiamine kinase-like enzyme
MIVEPEIDRAALQSALRAEYGLQAASLTFFPEGTVGCHYVADCADGQRAFVTLLTGGTIADQQAGRLDFILALRSRLTESGLFPAQPAVRRTLAGGLKAGFRGCPLVVSEYIDGANLWPAWPPGPGLGAELGVLAARLHAATPQLGMEVPFTERFRLPFEPLLRQCLAELAGDPRLERPGQRSLLEMILPRRDDLLQRADELLALAAQVRRLEAPFVLVHTDMHGGNLIRGPQGSLYVVDWEGAMLAPAEADLFLFAGAGLEAMLFAYRKQPGAFPLHPELFAYYLERRNLEDIAYFLHSTLHENTVDEQDDFDLRCVGECLNDHAPLAATVARIRKALAVEQA